MARINVKTANVADLAEDMIKDFDSKAVLAAKLIRDQLPMYTGELNPQWDFWNQVYHYLYSRIG